MNRNIKYILLIVIVLSFIYSCTKWNLEKSNPNDLPQISISEIINNTSHYTIAGDISDLGYNSKITNYGLVFDTSQNPSINESNQISKGGVTSLSSFSIDIYDLDTNKTYYIRDFATNEAGTTYSLNKSISTEINLNDTTNGNNEITLISPANNATTSYSETSFSWNTSGASISNLQLAYDINFSSIYFQDSTITGFSKNIQNLEQVTTYYWRVRSKINGIWSDWSSKNVFTTDGQASSITKPTLQSPSNGEILNNVSSVNFEWNNITEAT